MSFDLLSAVVILIASCGFICIFFLYNKHNRMRIEELNTYLEQINCGGTGTILQTREDEFSHLQDEIYKTVTNLYQTREAAVAAKVNYADNLANIAHQLKTPITAALLSLELLEENTENVNTNIYVNQMEKQLRRLVKLEEALLTISRIDAGGLQLECKKVDIYTLLNLAQDNLVELSAEKNITVDIPDKGEASFDGDMEWSMEAIMNLMKNCIEHTAQGGSIHCDYSSNPIYAEIRIWDEGCGFDNEDIPRIFERFYRGKNASENGIGIGLALAKSIFELQNGTISAGNLPEGGACFEIRIYSH